MNLIAAVLLAFLALACAQTTSPNASISILDAIAGFPELAAFTALIHGPLSTSSFNFVALLNSTSTSSPLTLFAPVNSAFSRFEANVPVSNLLFATMGNNTLLEIGLADHIIPTGALDSAHIAQTLSSAPSSRPLLLDFVYGKIDMTTLAGVNVSVRGIVQTGTETSLPPLLFVQNVLVVQTNAIVAGNGVVHLVSNIIDPFIDAAGMC